MVPDRLKTEIRRIDDSVKEQYRASSRWDSLKVGLHRMLSRSDVSSCEMEFPAGWTEAQNEGRGGVAIDIVYSTKDSSVVGLEVETSYMSASHDLLKLAYFAGSDLVIKVGVASYLGVIVTHEDPGLSGPQRGVYSRLYRRIDALRQSKVLGPVFRNLNLGLVGVIPTGSTLVKLWPMSDLQRVE